MALVNITNVQIQNNQTTFLSKFHLNITFECLRDIPDEIQWKLIYIGSAHDQSYDQILDQIEMGPLQAGVMQFSLITNPPDYKKIPEEQLLRVTAIILTVSYRKNEFFRVGYYVYNHYTQQQLIQNPPEAIQIQKIQRIILSDKPRITRSEIHWMDKQQIPTENASTNEVQQSSLKNEQKSP